MQRMKNNQKKTLNKNMDTEIEEIPYTVMKAEITKFLPGLLIRNHEELINYLKLAAKKRYKKADHQLKFLLLALCTIFSSRIETRYKLWDYVSKSKVDNKALTELLPEIFTQTIRSSNRGPLLQVREEFFKEKKWNIH